jgi:xanthine dehydrogenase accessory factor
VNLFERLADAIANESPIVLATRVDPLRPGAKLLVDGKGASGDLGSPGLNAAVEAEARALLSAAQTSLRSFGPDGEPIGVGAQIFIQSFAPKPEMFVFGAIDFSRAMATLGKYLGYRVTVVDARPVFATQARIPDADQIVVAWPDEFLERAAVTESTVLIVLTHDVKFDIPLLKVAFATKAGYIGVMGSRRTHAQRIEALRADGATDAQLARLCAPVGLDIGARTPEETAISIAAEIVALRAGRHGGRLRDSTLPVHGPPLPQAS